MTGKRVPGTILRCGLQKNSMRSRIASSIAERKCCLVRDRNRLIHMAIKTSSDPPDDQSGCTSFFDSVGQWQKHHFSRSTRFRSSCISLSWLEESETKEVL